MAEHSSIEWTDATWTPIRARNKATGRLGHHCEHASEGCRNCYAEKINLRLGTKLPFKPGHRKDIDIFLDEKMLLAPLRWKKPRMIFVCSMTDLFADFVPDDMIDRVFAVMMVTSLHESRGGHSYQVLTKRSARMRAYLSDPQTQQRVAVWAGRLMEDGDGWLDLISSRKEGLVHPCIWLGVSAEAQQEADARIPDLLATPAAVRFVSLEPLLGPIDLTHICLLPQKPGSHRAGIHLNALAGRYFESGMPYVGDWDVDDPAGPPDIPPIRLDWVIVGGESQAGARPMHPDWARSIRDQCAEAGVPFLFKQVGSWTPEKPANYHRVSKSRWSHESRTFMPDGTEYRATEPDMLFEPGMVTLYRVAKKAAGRLLDGVEHNGMPGDVAKRKRVREVA